MTTGQRTHSLWRHLAWPARYALSWVHLGRFLGRNLWCARRLTPFPIQEQGGVILHPLIPSQLCDVEILYTRLSQGRRLGRDRRWLLRMLGGRLCLVALDSTSGQVVGVSLYYFNPRDRRENTIHEGFSGVEVTRQRQGIGSSLRRHALAHFGNRGLGGVSSRISLSNLASLKSNLQLGFHPVEQYFDPAMGEERYYLVCRFEGRSDPSGQPSIVQKDPRAHDNP